MGLEWSGEERREDFFYLVGLVGCLFIVGLDRIDSGGVGLRLEMGVGRYALRSIAPGI